MPIRFYREPIENTTYHPEVLGVDFTERMAKLLGKFASEGVDVFIALAEVMDDELGEGYTVQVTQDNCRVLYSHLDPESDVILFYDKRDGQHFRYSRCDYQEDDEQKEMFEYVFDTVAPWAMNVVTLVPPEESYARVIERLQGDLSDLDDIVDSW